MVSNRSHRLQQGFTFVELMVCLVLLGILASVVMPVSQLASKQFKENELSRNLLVLRQAIDSYKTASDKNEIPKEYKTISGYPPNLKILEGIKNKDGKIIVQRFIRRVPTDPFHDQNDNNDLPENTWGQRSYLSEHNHPLKGEDIYDVYSLSEQKGSNGISYTQW